MLLKDTSRLTHQHNTYYLIPNKERDSVLKFAQNHNVVLDTIIWNPGEEYLKESCLDKIAAEYNAQRKQTLLKKKKLSKKEQNEVVYDVIAQQEQFLKENYNKYVKQQKKNINENCIIFNASTGHYVFTYHFEYNEQSETRTALVLHSLYFGTIAYNSRTTCYKYKWCQKALEEVAKQNNMEITKSNTSYCKFLIIPVNSNEDIINGLKLIDQVIDEYKNNYEKAKTEQKLSKHYDIQNDFN